uniref:UDP-glucuronosyltransferase 2B31 n=2 Tax=Lygus hesperus TaxID=30085 RepID=A0A0A9WC55_LYGHE
MTWFHFGVFVVLAACAGVSSPAKILVFLPMPWKSHHFFYHPVIEALGKRGHQVDYLTPVPLKNPPSTVKHLMIGDNLAEMMVQAAPEEMVQPWSPTAYFRFRDQIYDGLEHVFKNEPAVKNLLSSTDKYDMVISECQLMQELNAIWAHKFNAIPVSLLSVPDSSFINELNGLPDNPSYQVDIFSTFTNKMSFIDRLKSSLSHVSSLAINYYKLRNLQQLADELARYPGWEERPPLSELASDMALVLVNSQVSVTYSTPKPPHVKEIGGMTLNVPSELPEDLKSFMDNADEGIVYFSLGSNVNMSIITDGGRKLPGFLGAFKALKQKVLFKWSGSTLPKVNDPKIWIREWFPQRAILQHKNTRVFVTHGGLQSTIETTDSGVPTVGIPIFADQLKNVEFLVHIGSCVKLDKSNLTKDSLYWAINEVAGNPRYKAAAQSRSVILKDVPMKPIDEVIYWLEYVLRHGRVLQPASVHMPFYQVHQLDVLAFLVGSLVTSYLIIVRIVCALCCAVRGKCKQQNSNKIKRINKP